jgi:TRAP-type C4-dicarboxylate transport system substrate-binding protein
MKRLTITFFVLGLCFILSGAFDNARGAGPRELSLNLTIPPVHNRWNLAIKVWCDELEKRTGGAVKVTPYFSQALSSLFENYDSVVENIADMGEGPMGVKPGQFPLITSVFSLNRPSRFITDGTALLYELLAAVPELQKELDKTKTLAISAQCGMQVGTAKKALKSVENFKGIKLNAMGSGIAIEKTKALGFSVVSLPPQDHYMALEKGVVDGTTGDFDMLVSRKMTAVVPYMHTFSIFILPFYMYMNWDVYNSLPKAVREVIDELSGDFSRKLFADFWTKSMMKSWDAYEKEFGGQTIYYSQEELDKMDAICQPIADGWVQDMEKKGYSAKRIMNTFRKLEDKYTIPWSKGAAIRN